MDRNLPDSVLSASSTYNSSYTTDRARMDKYISDTHCVWAAADPSKYSYHHHEEMRKIYPANKAAYWPNVSLIVGLASQTVKQHVIDIVITLLVQ